MIFLAEPTQSLQNSDTSGTLQVTSTQFKASPTSEQTKKKPADVPGSARALSTSLEQRMDGE